MKAKRGFQFFTGDVNWRDYGGTWIRQVAARRFHFLQVTNMVEACGRDNDGQPTYAVELSEVDLDAIGEVEQSRALASCGFEVTDAADRTANGTADCVAGACFEYGNRAPLHGESTNNVHAGFRACRAESYRLTSDAEAYAEAMDRPVNKLGSTAREYMTGDITSAIVRGAEEGNPSAQIMARMYVAAEGQTLGGAIPPGDLEAMRGAIDGDK